MILVLGEHPKSCLQEVKSWLSILSFETTARIKQALFQTTFKHENNKNTGISTKAIQLKNYKNKQVRWLSKIAKLNFLQTLVNH